MPLPGRSSLFLGLSVFLLTLPFAAVAQAPLLPAQLAGWQRTDWIQVEAPELERVAGPELGLLGTARAWAAVMREYGCQRVEWARYRHDATRSQGEVTVYEMQDRSGAYGAFTLLGLGGLDPVLVTNRRVAMGEAGVAGVDAGLFYQGQYVVNWWMGTPVLELVEHLKQLGGQQASLPTLPSYLPREGFIEGSDRYLLGPLGLAQVAPLFPGDWVGFAYAAEVEAARYRVDAGEATLLVISYPTPQIAAERLRDFERLFNLNGTGDPGRALAYAKRSGTLVVFVAGPASEQAATQLLDRVRYEAEISWSEPSEPRPEVNWAKTLLNIFIGTGLMLLFALLSGLAFGVVRLIINRLAPGKVFDRPQDTEIIQLNLGRRI